MNEAASDFWAWSLAAYEREGVAARLLALQDDHDLNVNLLLWCAWCASGRGEISELVMRKAMDLSGSWSRDVTAALRGARRALKAPPPQADADAAATLREDVKRAELAAERIEQNMLQQLAADQLSPSPDAGSAARRLRRNLARYAELARAPGRRDFSMSLLDELAHAILPDKDSGPA